MENATDALKMAGAVLLFVMALSICIVSFSQAREATDLLLEYRDKDNEYNTFGYVSYTDEYGQPIYERTVGLETVIPTIYRAYKENFKIVFDFKDGTENYIYKKDDSTEVNSIDLEKGVAIANDGKAKEFIEGILYKKFNKDETQFCKDFGIKALNNNSLYSKLKAGKKITEHLGVYYQEELSTTNQANDSVSVTPSTSGTSTGETVPDANKTEKRIITYTITNI